MSKLPVNSVALTNPEAKLIMIALRARCARLQNKLLHVEDTAKAQVEADRVRTSVLLAKIDKAFPESNFHHARPTAPSAKSITPYQQAVCDYADEMAQHIFDPNSYGASMNYEEIESLAKAAQEFRAMLQDVLEEQQKIAKSPNPSPDWVQRVADRKSFAVRHLAGIREDLIKEVTGHKQPVEPTERENDANWNLQEGNG